MEEEEWLGPLRGGVFEAAHDGGFAMEPRNLGAGGGEFFEGGGRRFAVTPYGEDGDGGWPRDFGNGEGGEMQEEGAAGNVGAKVGRHDE